ncbi:MAG: hypothetical protein AB8G22_25895 [Saprospiraceae bacterium]
MLLPKLLFFLLFAFPSLLAAQGILKSGALVYYYDGSIFQGKIVDENELQLSIKIVTKDTVTVEKAFMERYYRIPDDIQLFKNRRFHYNSGFFQTASLTLILNPLDGNTTHLDYVFGKRITPRIAAGVGTGIYFNDSYPSGLWLQTHFLPVFAYGRYYLTQKRRRLYAAGRLGYSFALQDGFNGQHSGGIMLMPEVGVHFAGRKKSRFTIGLTQYLQTTKGENINFDQFGNTIETRFNLILNRTLLRIGWEFR